MTARLLSRNLAAARAVPKPSQPPMYGIPRPVRVRMRWGRLFRLFLTAAG